MQLRGRGQFNSQLNYKQVPYLITYLVPTLEACEFRVLTSQGGIALSGELCSTFDELSLQASAPSHTCTPSYLWSNTRPSLCTHMFFLGFLPHVATLEG